MVPEFVCCPAAATGCRPGRPAASGCRLSLSAAPTGVFRESPENRRIRGLQSMVPEFVCCPAAATGCRHCLPAIRRESCGFEETSRSNLWRLVSCAIRRQQPAVGTADPVSRACRPRRGRRSRQAPGPRCSRRPDGCSTRSRRRARRGPRGRWRARWWRSGAACRPAWGS